MEDVSGEEHMGSSPAEDQPQPLQLAGINTGASEQDLVCRPTSPPQPGSVHEVLSPGFPCRGPASAPAPGLLSPSRGLVLALRPLHLALVPSQTAARLSNAAEGSAGEDSRRGAVLLGPHGRLHLVEGAGSAATPPATSDAIPDSTIAPQLLMRPVRPLPEAALLAATAGVSPSFLKSPSLSAGASRPLAQSLVVTNPGAGLSVNTGLQSEEARPQLLGPDLGPSLRTKPPPSMKPDPEGAQHDTSERRLRLPGIVAGEVSNAGDGSLRIAEGQVPPLAAPPAPQIEVTVATRVGANSGRRARTSVAAGRQPDEDSRSGYVRGPVCGVFDVARYLADRDCILYNGRWLSRSHFEKVGGSKMAKWYKSIRVIPGLEPLGEWLERHRMPVARGPSRRSSKRAPEGLDFQALGESRWRETSAEAEGSYGAAPLPVGPVGPSRASALLAGASEAYGVNAPTAPAADISGLKTAAVATGISSIGHDILGGGGGGGGISGSNAGSLSGITEGPSGGVGQNAGSGGVNNSQLLPERPLLPPVPRLGAVTDERFLQRLLNTLSPSTSGPLLRQLPPDASASPHHAIRMASPLSTSIPTAGEEEGLTVSASAPLQDAAHPVLQSLSSGVAHSAAAPLAMRRRLMHQSASSGVGATMAQQSPWTPMTQMPQQWTEQPLHAWPRLQQQPQQYQPQSASIELQRLPSEFEFRPLSAVGTIFAGRGPGGSGGGSGGVEMLDSGTGPSAVTVTIGDGMEVVFDSPASLPNIRHFQPLRVQGPAQADQPTVVRRVLQHSAEGHAYRPPGGEQQGNLLEGAGMSAMGVVPLRSVPAHEAPLPLRTPQLHGFPAPPEMLYLQGRLDLSGAKAEPGSEYSGAEPPASGDPGATSEPEFTDGERRRRRRLGSVTAEDIGVGSSPQQQEKQQQHLNLPYNKSSSLHEPSMTMPETEPPTNESAGSFGRVVRRRVLLPGGVAGEGGESAPEAEG